MTDNLATVLDSEIDAQLGEFPAVAGVEAALQHTFGL